MGTIADLNELTLPAVGDFVVVRDISDVTDKDKKMALGKLGLLDYANIWTASQSITGAARLGIGTASPQTKLHIVGALVTGADYSANEQLVVENNGTAAINLISAPSGFGILMFSDDVASQAHIAFGHTTNQMTIVTSGVARMWLDSKGVAVGSLGPQTKLHVFGNLGAVPGATYVNEAALVVENNGHNFLELFSKSDSYGGVYFSDAQARGVGQILYNHVSNDLAFVAGGAAVVFISVAGAVNIPYIWNAAGIAGTNVVVNGDGTLRKSSSSIRYKKDVADLAPKVYGDEFIKALRPVTYRAIDDKSKRKYVGLIAEEVQAIGDGAGELLIARNDEGQVESLYYERLVPLLVGAVQRLLKRVEVLEGAA